MTNIQFSPKALETIRIAQDCAGDMGHSYVECQHLLLGLSLQDNTIAKQCLKAVGLDSPSLRYSILRRYQGETGILRGLSKECSQIISKGGDLAKKSSAYFVEPEHLLLGILTQRIIEMEEILMLQGISDVYLKEQVEKSIQTPNPTEEGKETKMLNQVTRDLTELAREGKLDPVIGRETELGRMIQILSRRSKNNPVLVGEAGVGKTAVVEGLARAIIEKKVPTHLMNIRVCTLDLAAMVAGTKYRGEFEEKLRSILKEVRESNNILLFIDELHSIVGAGSAEGAIDAANILKPALSRGEIQVIGATTLEEYSKYIEKDAALERRFQPVTVKEPNRETTLSILQGLRPRYESHHNMEITDETLIAAVDLSHRYLPSRFWPDKAIDLVDEAASQARLSKFQLPPHLKELSTRVQEVEAQLSSAMESGNMERVTMLRYVARDFSGEFSKEHALWQKKNTTSQVLPTHIYHVLSQWTGVPVSDPNQQDKEALKSLELRLKETLLGQEQAVTVVAQAIRRGRLGLKDPNRPVGTFLLLGPSGVGKTQLCRTLAKTLFGTEEALIRFDMSEYMESHSVSRLIGSPPGYIGHDAGGQLTTRVKKNPWSVVLLDELEKAHPDIWAILLQVMEEGCLTDSQGRVIDFRNTVVVMTSNIGSSHFKEKQTLGFLSSEESSHRTNLEKAVRKEAENTFAPEFINRLDNLLVFHPLEEESLYVIVRQLLEQTQIRLRPKGMTLQVTDSAIKLLAQRGKNKNYGARPLRRAIATLIEDPVAELLLKEESGTVVQVSADQDKVLVEFV